MSYFEALIEKHYPGWDGHTNEAGLALIKKYEGWRAEPYLCSARRPTIGYGSCWDLDGDPVTLSHPSITKEQGEYLLKREVRHSEAAVKKLIKAEMTPNMFSSLVSFCYNVGSGNLQRSSLRMRMNRGQYLAAADELPKWRRALGKILPGLVRRRAEERRLFLDGYE